MNGGMQAANAAGPMPIASARTRLSWCSWREHRGEGDAWNVEANGSCGGERHDRRWHVHRRPAGWPGLKMYKATASAGENLSHRPV